MDQVSISFRAATAAEIRPLRHAVLRAGMPIESAYFPGDDDPTTRHFAAIVNRQFVGIVSMMLNQFEGKPAWQLRGMATADGFRGQGIGSKLLQFMEKEIRANSSVHAMWCNARKPAVRFYEKAGWRVVSEEFEVPTAGPHFKMIKDCQHV